MESKNGKDFLLGLDICASSASSDVCITNTQKQTLMTHIKEVDTNKEKYENMKMKYNREIFQSVNLCSGVALLLLYLYYNKK